MNDQDFKDKIAKELKEANHVYSTPDSEIFTGLHEALAHCVDNNFVFTDVLEWFEEWSGKDPSPTLRSIAAIVDEVSDFSDIRDISSVFLSVKLES